MPVPVFLAAAMIAWLARRGDGDAWLAGWLAAVALVLGVRMIVLARLPAMDHWPTSRRLRVAVTLSAINGATHAFAALAFAATTNFHFAIQTLLLVGLCAGAVATTAGYRPVFLAYVIPVIGTLVATWALRHADDSGGAIAVIIAIFGFVLVSLAADSYRLFDESFNIRSQQASLNARLSAALGQAESANRAKTRFLASASHDLRQPIHTISLFAAALALRPLEPISREIAGHIGESVHSLTGQLDALLDISKLDAGVVPVNAGVVSLRSFLRRVCHEYGPVAGERGLRLSMADGGALLWTDATLLGRVVGNLVDNAIKYTQDGEVRLSATRRAAQVVLSIEDTGAGIPAAEHDRVFEEFYQIDNPERNRAKGLGLGLSIVKRLAELLGARIDLASAPGRGTRFDLTFPEYLGGAEAEAPAAPDHNPLTRLHVLVVDDESMVSLAMTALLEGMGARVTAAEGTAGALAAVVKDPADLLLVDFRLRGSDDGIGVIAAVRTVLPDVPAILISGDTAPERLREARAAGVPLLHKPVHVGQLKQLVATLIPHSDR
jgi:signal transduction histidine kinase